MDLQYLFSSLYVRYVDVYLSVKSARTHKSRVEYVGSVCRRHNYNAFVLFKAVHLHKQLVEGLFSLVVSAAETRASLSAHGVYLVNEYDTRHILLCLIKEVSHSRRTGTHQQDVKMRLVRTLKRPMEIFSGMQVTAVHPLHFLQRADGKSIRLRV